MGTLGDDTRQRTGIGMTSVRTRSRMVERLREQGIKDEVVLAALQAVPRHIFVDEALAIRAYDDVPLPIGHGQTISQPWVVARMTELARNGRDLDTVLDVGTGCGYQTAVLAHVARHVFSVERIGALVTKARRHLQSLKLRNVSLKHGDGSHDLKEELAVDAIVVSAGATHVPSALLRYLKPGGRLVLPLSQPGDEKGVQRLTVLELSPVGIREQTLDAVRFVPLLGGLA
jgi:protein-L-isoaspartate(D-aspartate) O-methyltransferase